MKCLTILQPWATLLAIGAKTYETRRWSTKYRGPLLIHAGRRFTATAKSLAALEPFFTALAAAGYSEPKQLPLGAIIGKVDLTDCVPTDSLATQENPTTVGTQQLQADNYEAEECFGDFRLGRQAWKVINPTNLVVPIQYQGTLGLFDVGDDMIQDLCFISPKEFAELNKVRQSV